jgi:hypothetical protein
MLVWIVASQRLDPVRPEDGEHSETAAKAREWSDQSNLGDGRLIAGVLGARLRASPAREHCCSYPGSDGRECSRNLIAAELQPLTSGGHHDRPYNVCGSLALTSVDGKGAGGFPRAPIARG